MLCAACNRYTLNLPSNLHTASLFVAAGALATLASYDAAKLAEELRGEGHSVQASWAGRDVVQGNVGQGRARVQCRAGQGVLQGAYRACNHVGTNCTVMRVYTRCRGSSAQGASSSAADQHTLAALRRCVLWVPPALASQAMQGFRALSPTCPKPLPHIITLSHAGTAVHLWSAPAGQLRLPP